MNSLIFNRVSLVWLGLIGATALSWVLGHGFGLPDVRQAGVGILVVAFIKVRYVLLDFMELRHAPVAMRAVAEAWVVIVCSVLVWLFLSAPQAHG